MKGTCTYKQPATATTTEGKEHLEIVPCSARMIFMFEGGLGRQGREIRGRYDSTSVVLEDKGLKLNSIFMCSEVEQNKDCGLYKRHSIVPLPLFLMFNSGKEGRWVLDKEELIALFHPAEQDEILSFTDRSPAVDYCFIRTLWNAQTELGTKGQEFFLSSMAGGEIQMWNFVGRSVEEHLT